MPVDSLLIVRRSFHHDQPWQKKMSWDAVAAVLLVIMLVILLVSHLLSSDVTPTTVTTAAATTGTPNMTTTMTVPAKVSERAMKFVPYREFEDVPVIPAVPEVLICGTSGVGSGELPRAISAYCSHAIFTGELTVDEDDYGAYYFHVPDKEALSEFLNVKDPVKRYVSVGCTVFRGNGSAALVAAVSRFLSKHELSGVELRAGSQEDLDAAVLLSRTFHRTHPTDLYLILRVSSALLPDKKFFEDVSMHLEHIIFESQELEADHQHSIRFPNPYQSSEKAVSNGTFLKQQLSKVWALRQSLERADGWCLSLSLGVIKNIRDSLYMHLARITRYDYTSLHEVCGLLNNGEVKSNPRSMSRFLNTDYVFYGFEDRHSLVHKMSRLLHEFPGMCLAAYDVERDDVDGYCRASGHDVGAPLIGVLHSMVFPQ